MKRLFINTAILIVAIITFIIFGTFGLIYGLVAPAIKYSADLAYALSMGIDQLGNVLLSTFLNRFCLKEPDVECKFGKVSQTISHVLAVNIINNNLTSFGVGIVKALEWADPGHMQKSL